MKYKNYWKDICRIHLLTKHYLLIAEEMSADGEMFLQPLKEHRDAYDHIIRVYAAQSGMSRPDNLEHYIKSNLSKAIGHEYRAFFDTADWLSMICRDIINNVLKGTTVEEIERKYSHYKELKEFLLKLPEMIAEQREHKDIGSDLLTEVDQYAELLDRLIQYYKDLVEVFEIER